MHVQPKVPDPQPMSDLPVAGCKIPRTASPPAPRTPCLTCVLWTAGLRVQLHLLSPVLQQRINMQRPGLVLQRSRDMRMLDWLHWGGVPAVCLRLHQVRLPHLETAGDAKEVYNWQASVLLMLHCRQLVTIPDRRAVRAGRCAVDMNAAWLLSAWRHTFAVHGFLPAQQR